MKIVTSNKTDKNLEFIYPRIPYMKKHSVKKRNSTKTLSGHNNVHNINKEIMILRKVKLT